MHYQGMASNSEDFIEHFSPVNSSSSNINYIQANHNSKKGTEGFGPASNRNQFNTIHVAPIASPRQRRGMKVLLRNVLAAVC